MAIPLNGLFVHLNLRVTTNAGVELAFLEYDGSAQLHFEQRYATGWESESAGVDIDIEGFFVDRNANYE